MLASGFFSPQNPTEDYVWMACCKGSSFSSFLKRKKMEIKKINAMFSALKYLINGRLNYMSNVEQSQKVYVKHNK